MTDWLDMKNERDSDGLLTDLAMALDSIEGNGCDCSTDAVGAECIACLSERALKKQWNTIASLERQLADCRAENARLREALSDILEAVRESGTAQDGQSPHAFALRLIRTTAKQALKGGEQ